MGRFYEKSLSVLICAVLSICLGTTAFASYVYSKIVVLQSKLLSFEIKDMN